MTPNDKKSAGCTNCEFYYNKIDPNSSPLGWCRNGYGRAIHLLLACPKIVAKLAAKKEKDANAALNPKLHVKPAAKPLPKNKQKIKQKRPVAKSIVPTVVIKAKKVTEPPK